MTCHPLVYVITLSWNRCQETLSCLDSVRKLDYPNKQLLLIDNGSTDGTPQQVADHFPEVEIIINEENLGFAAGCNQGLRHALLHGGEYVLLLNNDTIIDPTALSHLMDLTGPDVGMVAPKIYYASDPFRLWSTGGMRHPLTIETTGDARGQLDDSKWDAVLERDYFVGCALLLSRRLLTEVGLFDERFFMYYEDSDLSFRARQSGFRLLLSPKARVWHKVSTSSGGSDSPNERYWIARSSVLFFHKHVHGLRWLVVLPYRSATAVKTIMRLAWRRRLSSARAYLRGLRDGLADARRVG